VWKILPQSQFLLLFALMDLWSVDHEWMNELQTKRMRLDLICDSNRISRILPIPVEFDWLCMLRSWLVGIMAFRSVNVLHCWKCQFAFLVCIPVLQICIPDDLEFLCYARLFRSFDPLQAIPKYHCPVQYPINVQPQVDHTVSPPERLQTGRIA
jgi:hypothetical protein